MRLKDFLPTAAAITCVALLGCGGHSSSSSTSTVDKITVAPTTATVAVNRQQAFTASALDASGNVLTGGTFTWASSDTTIATVDQTGVATGKSGGTAQITASTGTVTSSPATLTVQPAVASVAISPTSATIHVGATQQFTATATDVKGNTITGAQFSWSISFSGIATIDSSGLATGISPGTVVVTANSGGISSPVATLNVVP